MNFDANYYLIMCHANQIHGYTHHLVYYVVLFELMDSLFFVVLLYALRVICVSMLRSLKM